MQENQNAKKKKIKQVAALKYSPGKNDAPVVVALGKGVVAVKIIEKAKESGVPVNENEELAVALNKMKIGDEIPPELYEVVSRILLFVGAIDKIYGEINE